MSAADHKATDHVSLGYVTRVCAVCATSWPCPTRRAACAQENGTLDRSEWTDDVLAELGE